MRAYEASPQSGRARHSSQAGLLLIPHRGISRVIGVNLGFFSQARSVS